MLLSELRQASPETKAADVRRHSPLAAALAELAAKQTPGNRAPQTSPHAQINDLPGGDNQHPPPATPKAERRVYPRRVSRCTVAVCPSPPESGNNLPATWQLHSSRIKGTVVDISRNGICMALGRGMRVHDAVCLKISNPLCDRSLITLAEVVRQENDDRGRWRVMCRFSQPLEFEQIEFFGQYLFASSVV